MSTSASRAVSRTRLPQGTTGVPQHQAHGSPMLQGSDDSYHSSVHNNRPDDDNAGSRTRRTRKPPAWLLEHVSEPDEAAEDESDADKLTASGRPPAAGRRRTDHSPASSSQGPEPSSQRRSQPHRKRPHATSRLSRPHRSSGSGLGGQQGQVA
eukprot:jgi/Chrzof1/825/Cz01g30090.t1